MKSRGVPLLVAGMHRSGLALAGSLLRAAGAEMNAPEFCALQTDILRRNALDVGGWTRTQPAVAEEMRGRATELLEIKSASGVWGWVDARSTLLLEFWRAVSAEARFMLVYRTPWEVADSLFRSGGDAETFAADPRLALRYWSYYNQLVLACARADRNRCVLVSVDALAGNAGGVIDLLNKRFGLGLTVPAEGTYDAGRLGREATGSRWPAVVAAYLPECLDVLAQLERVADLPGGPSGVKAMDSEAASQQLVEDWFERRRMERELRRAKQLAAAARAERETTSRTLVELREQATSQEKMVAGLRSERQLLTAQAEKAKSEIDAAKSRADAANAEAARLAQQQTELRTHSEAVAKQRDEARLHASGLQLRANELLAHTEGLEQLRAEGRQRLEELRKHAENLTSRTTELTAHAEGLEKGLAESRKHAEGLTGRVAELTAHTQGLETLLAESRKHVAALTARVTELTAHTEGLEKVLAEKRQHAEGLEKLLAEKRQHAESLEKLFAEARQQIESLKGRVAELEALDAGLEKTLTETRQHEAAVETMLGDTQKDVANLQSTRGELQKQIRDLQAELVDAKRARTMIKRLIARPFGGGK